VSTLPQYPTAIHRQAAEAIVDFASREPIEAALVVNSCARGTAVTESDLDVALLVLPDTTLVQRTSISQRWDLLYQQELVFRELEQLSRFSRVHLDVFDGRWAPEVWDDGGGPDAFELEIGNRIAYSVPIWERSEFFHEIRAQWLPYYTERLREQRRRMVSNSCRLNIARVHAACGRGLDFYAFDRLYHAFQEFLQALFIAHRTYPIAYNKWIQEQVEGLLGLKSVYEDLRRVLTVSQWMPHQFVQNADLVDALLRTWATPDG
jgi:predicted nucleotidyltransferase